MNDDWNPVLNIDDLIAVYLHDDLDQVRLKHAVDKQRRLEQVIENWQSSQADDETYLFDDNDITVEDPISDTKLFQSNRVSERGLIWNVTIQVNRNQNINFHQEVPSPNLTDTNQDEFNYSKGTQMNSERAIEDNCDFVDLTIDEDSGFGSCRSPDRIDEAPSSFHYVTETVDVKPMLVKTEENLVFPDEEEEQIISDDGKEFPDDPTNDDDGDDDELGIVGIRYSITEWEKLKGIRELASIFFEGKKTDHSLSDEQFKLVWPNMEMNKNLFPKERKRRLNTKHY